MSDNDYDAMLDIIEDRTPEYRRELDLSGLDRYLTDVGRWPDAEPSKPCAHVAHDPLCHHCREAERLGLLPRFYEEVA